MEFHFVSKEIINSKKIFAIINSYVNIYDINYDLIKI
jgi:hypothetical protein